MPLPSPPNGSYPPHAPPDTIDPNQCSLLGPTALVVQGLMGILVIVSLLIKRQFEASEKKGKQRRKWKVWMLDVSKQIVAQGCLHMSNLLISDTVSHHAGSNPCSLYFLNILVDTTIGVLVLYGALKGLTWICVRYGPWKKEGFITGVYGDPPRMSFFVRQLLVYLASIFVMKIAVLCLFAITLNRVLLPFASWVLDWMRESLQVVFSMALFPLAMNVLQFCIIDSLIKAGNLVYGEETHPDDDVEGGLNRKVGAESPSSPSSTHRTPLLTPTHSPEGSSHHRTSRGKRKVTGRSQSPGISTALLTEYPDEDDMISPALSATRGSQGYGSLVPSPARSLDLDSTARAAVVMSTSEAEGREERETGGASEALSRVSMEERMGMHTSRVSERKAMGDRLRREARRSLSSDEEDFVSPAAKAVEMKTR